MNPPSVIRTSTADLYDTYVMKNYARAPLTLVRGQGTRVWDDQGRSYLDFTSGIAVSIFASQIKDLLDPIKLTNLNPAQDQK